MLSQCWRELGLIERVSAVPDAPLQTLHGRGVCFLDCQGRRVHPALRTLPAAVPRGVPIGGGLLADTNFGYSYWRPISRGRPASEELARIRPDQPRWSSAVAPFQRSLRPRTPRSGCTCFATAARSGSTKIDTVASPWRPAWATRSPATCSRESQAARERSRAACASLFPKRTEGEQQGVCHGSSGAGAVSRRKSAGKLARRGVRGAADARGRAGGGGHGPGQRRVPRRGPAAGVPFRSLTALGRGPVGARPLASRPRSPTLTR